MALNSEELKQRINESDQALQQKDYKRSISLLESIIRENQDYAPAHRRLGLIYTKTKMIEKALTYLNKAIELAPDDAESWNALGKYYKHLKSWTESLNAFQKALKFTENKEQIFYEILKIHRILGQHESALILGEKLLNMRPDNINYIQDYAQLLKRIGRDEEALSFYDRLLKSSQIDMSTEGLEEWYELMLSKKDIKTLRHRLKELSRNTPGNITLKLLYGDSCEQDSDYEEAYRIWLDAHQSDPTNFRINHALGCMLNRVGDTDTSRKYLLKAIKNSPLSTDTLRILGTDHLYKYGDPFFSRLNFAATYLDQMSVKNKMHLHYALGKAYDDVGEFDTAFEHYKMGGILHSEERWNEPIEELHHFTSYIKEIMNKTFFLSNQNQGSESKKPVFVVGMLRSGSTLVEQVLSSMDKVYGAGEIECMSQALKFMKVGTKRINPDTFNPFPENVEINYQDRANYYLKCIEATAPNDSMFIINKMPTNFMFLGHIHLLFPNASIVHTRRHPVETCLSAYRLHFPLGHYWSDDLRTIGKYYRLYTETMIHWKSVLPKGTILDVRYEDMVNDLEGESKRLTDFIGIPWDASCLDFHQSKRAVRTASLSQVRQPIYKTSMNRWRKYEPYLKPLLDEIGDLVEEYEAELDTRTKGDGYGI